MAQEKTTLADFHPASRPELHRKNSIGNQQILDNGIQVGAIEYVPDLANYSLNVQLMNKSGKVIKGT